MSRYTIFVLDRFEISIDENSIKFIEIITIANFS